MRGNFNEVLEYQVRQLPKEYSKPLQRPTSGTLEGVNQLRYLSLERTAEPNLLHYRWQSSGCYFVSSAPR